MASLTTPCYQSHDIRTLIVIRGEPEVRYGAIHHYCIITKSHHNSTNGLHLWQICRLVMPAAWLGLGFTKYNSIYIQPLWCRTWSRVFFRLDKQWYPPNHFHSHCKKWHNFPHLLTNHVTFFLTEVFIDIGCSINGWNGPCQVYGVGSRLSLQLMSRNNTCKYRGLFQSPLSKAWWFSFR